MSHTQPPAPATPSVALYLKGAFFGLCAVSIWAGWLAFTRFSVSGLLDGFDIAALRFLVSGLLLFPLVLKKGWLIDRLGFDKLFLLICGAGAPYVMLIASGLQYAPAADAGAMFAGLMPLFVALISALILKEHFTFSRILGFGGIFTGVVILILFSFFQGALDRLIGYGFFCAAAFFWACFTILFRTYQINPLHATALVSTGSMIAYLPPYFYFAGLRILEAPLGEIVLQGFYQGVMTSIIALILFSRAVTLLGASSGAAFAALLPGFTALVAIAVMGERPGPVEWVIFAGISIGVYLASGGPLHRKKT